VNLVGRAAGLAGSVLRARAERTARRAARTALAIGVALLLFGLALVFGAVAGYVALDRLVGPVGAALWVAGGALVLGLLALAVARIGRRPDPGPDAAELRAELDALAATARHDLRQTAPYLAAAAFLSGFVFGRRK